MIYDPNAGTSRTSRRAPSKTGASELGRDRRSKATTTSRPDSIRRRNTRASCITTAAPPRQTARTAAAIRKTSGPPQGYVVYVIQPSGATGYGQEFSAYHVNDWGKIVAGRDHRGGEEVRRDARIRRRDQARVHRRLVRRLHDAAPRHEDRYLRRGSLARRDKLDHELLGRRLLGIRLQRRRRREQLPLEPARHLRRSEPALQRGQDQDAAPPPPWRERHERSPGRERSDVHGAQAPRQEPSNTSRFDGQNHFDPRLQEAGRLVENDHRRGSTASSRTSPNGGTISGRRREAAAEAEARGGSAAAAEPARAAAPVPAPAKIGVKVIEKQDGSKVVLGEVTREAYRIEYRGLGRRVLRLQARRDDTRRSRRPPRQDRDRRSFSAPGAAIPTEQVPRLWKVLDSIGFSPDALKTFAVERAKATSEAALRQELIDWSKNVRDYYAIKAVESVIVYRDGAEIGGSSKPRRNRSNPTCWRSCNVNPTRVLPPITPRAGSLALRAARHAGTPSASPATSTGADIPANEPIGALRLRPLTRAWTLPRRTHWRLCD